MNYPRRRKAPKMGLRTKPQVRSPKHLQFVRGYLCSIEGLVGCGHRHKCAGDVEAAHVRTGTDGGMGVKPSDFWAIPLCAAAHRESHAIGEKPFEQRYGIDMKAIAEGLARRSKFRKEWSD